MTWINFIHGVLSADGSLALHAHARYPAPAVRQYKDAASKFAKLTQELSRRKLRNHG